MSEIWSAAASGARRRFRIGDLSGIALLVPPHPISSPVVAACWLPWMVAVAQQVPVQYNKLDS